MQNSAGTVTYVARARFADVLIELRDRLAAHKLRVVREADLAHRMAGGLGIRMPSCHVLYVWPEDLPPDDELAEAAVFLPLHIVVSAHGDASELAVRSLPATELPLSPRAASLVVRAHRDVMRAVECMSMLNSLI